MTAYQGKRIRVETLCRKSKALLTLLFVQEYEVFKGCHINLQGSWLNGANLKEARLAKADSDLGRTCNSLVLGF